MRFTQCVEVGSGDRIEAGGAKPLFITGASRTGTTALCNYLNVHPEVCVLTERYKYVTKSVTPEYFSFARIRNASHRSEETNLAPLKSEGVLDEKDEGELKIVGDKAYGYSLNLNELLLNNSNLILLVTLRDPVAMATSYAEMRRSVESEDSVHKAPRLQNKVLRNVRKFIQEHPEVTVIFVEYEAFYTDDGAETHARLFSEAVGLDLSGCVAVWKKKNRAFAAKYEEIIAARRGSSLEGRRLSSEDEQRVLDGTNDRLYEWARNRADEQRRSVSRAG